MFLRTAKSCDPDAPTLASSSRRQVGPTGLRHAISADDGGKQARSPGRARRKPLKPLRAGMPGDSGVLVVTRVRSTTIIAHETAGALGIRHSPRPLSGGKYEHGPGASRRGDAMLRLMMMSAPHAGPRQQALPRENKMVAKLVGASVLVCLVGLVALRGATGAELALFE